MYSRKFGQGNLPPDYSGVSFRRPSESEVPDGDCDNCLPRYPTERREEVPRHHFKVKRQTPSAEVKKQPPPPEHTPPIPKATGPLAGHSFTMEDIVLAGLILLLLNSDCDSELILILGFLLLVGLQ